MPGKALSLSEREEIRAGLERRESFTAIGDRLGRPTSTVAREVDRNGGRREYRAVMADAAAASRRCRPRRTKFQQNNALADAVEAGLAEKLSPMVIARGIADLGGATVCHETIYAAVYAHGRRGLAAGLHRNLHRQRRCRRRRRPDSNEPVKTGPLGLFNLIGTRPDIADRSVVGHWEGDLILGAFGRSAVVTLVERATRFNLLADLPEGHGAEAVLAALVELLDRVPAGLRRTLTWDQGREMARHHQLDEIVGIDVFFAEPHSPWQRGSNENFNGLVRRWLPKSTNLSIYSQTDLDVISHRINAMPRRLHAWESAAERYDAALVAMAA